jgi:hypothetical protein
MSRRLRQARRALILALCGVLPSCATLFGHKNNYRTDGLATLDVRVIGPPSCGGCAQAAPTISPGVQAVLVTIRGPAGASMDTLRMLTDVHGQALFEGVQPGRYTLVIQPPPGFPLAAPRRANLRANAKRSIVYRLDSRTLLTGRRGLPSPRN